MRIKKVYLKNFKGIRDKKIIDFENPISLLIGPNGFGKTTIYDAIELCLTDQIHRTLKKGTVTHHRTDYNKMFFQNDVKEDVIVKVWLEKLNNDKKEDLIITKYLPHEDEKRNYKRGRKHKPDDFYLLQTYSDNPHTFSEDEFNPAKHKKLKNEELNDFFEFDSSDIKIKDIYHLFNYLQQEETTFFLKQSESDRKNSLGFLFNTNNEELHLRKLSTAIERLKKIKTQLDVKIRENNKIQEIDTVEYIPLFSNKDIEFDNEVLFESENLDVSTHLYKKYIAEINKIIKFINHFSPEEYFKKQSVELLDKLKKNDEFINYYILHKLIKSERYNQLKFNFELKENKQKLKAFILQNHIRNYQVYKNNNEKHEMYDKFLKINDFEEKLDGLKSLVENLIPKEKESYLELVNLRKQLKDTSSDNKKMITEIIQSRNNLKIKFENHMGDDQHDTSCPYCGFMWQTYEKLNIEFSNREKSFRKLLDEQSNKLVEIDGRLTENYINPITKIILKFKEENKKIDIKIIEELERLQDRTFDFTDLDKIVSTEVAFEKIESFENLEKNLNKLERNIEANMEVSSDLFKKIRFLSVRTYEDEIESIKDVLPEDELDKYIFDKYDRQKTLQDLKEHSDNLKKFLEEGEKLYVYKNNKTIDEFNLFNEYFESDPENFNQVNVNDLEQKRKYINYIFSRNQSKILNKYRGRKDRLDAIIINMKEIKKCIDVVIKKYKKEMADNIKIPFYIYSAKILQNYQQGMGIFLSTKENSDSIRFLTDSSSDHDAIHHLSSGQLAVTSIAFTLAINKTYNVSQNLKFIAIDDPIQEMDSMNIHSFIELISHEFINDYQLIISTHNDINALFMKYKFEKVLPKKVSLINVQSKFFE